MRFETAAKSFPGFVSGIVPNRFTAWATHQSPGRRLTRQHARVIFDAKITGISAKDSSVFGGQAKQNSHEETFEAGVSASLSRAAAIECRLSRGQRRDDSPRMPLGSNTTRLECYSA